MPETDQAPRVRYAKREITRALEALELLADNPQLDYGIRLLHAEERLEDQREETSYWRRYAQSLQQLMAASGREVPEPGPMP